MAKEKETKDLTEIPEDIMSMEDFKEGKSKGKGNVFIGTLNVALRPAKAVTSLARGRFESKYKGKYKRARLLFYIDMALLAVMVILAIIAVFFWLWKPSVADKINVQASILPEMVTSGEEVTFVWVYRNDSEVTLDNMQWSITLPNNFEIIDTTPRRSDPLKNVVELGTLPPGGEGRIKLHGQAWGTIGDTETVWSNLSFVQAENNKKEQKVITTSYYINDSVLAADLSAPEQIINNQEIDLKINYANNFDKELKGVEIHAYWPAGFQYLSSELALQDNVWSLGNLAPGDSGEINVRGFLASPEDQANFYFETYYKVKDENVRQEVLASGALIVPPQIEVLSFVNGESEPKLSWGEQMNIEVSYASIGDFALEDLEFAVEVDPYLINTSRMEGAEFRDGKFYFTQEAESVAPGETKKANAKLWLKGQPDFANFDDPTNITFPMGVAVNYRVQGEDQTALYKTGRRQIKMKSSFWAQAFARYWAETGDQLGRGPMPPRVGRETKYWVFWNLGKTTGELNNIYLQAKLPANVTYTGLSSVTVGDKINYNPESNIITWTLKDLEPTIVNQQVVAISFEVGVTPSAEQSGSAAALVEWIKTTAGDEFTGEEVSYTNAAITTDLNYDSRAEGLGMVR